MSFQVIELSTDDDKMLTMNEVAVKHINTSVPVPSKMMASKKKHLI